LLFVQSRLRQYNIRGASDYAEVLVEEALHGQRAVSGVSQGYDVTASQYGWVEVKDDFKGSMFSQVA